MLVQIQGLNKTYGPTKAVDNLSFSFTSGEVYGFIGPNGAGKTTTMRVLCGLEEPNSGDCFVNGVSVVEFPDQAQRMVGYVPDLLPVHRDVSVHEYLDFFARVHGIRNPKRKRVVHEIEEFTNLLGIKEKPLTGLSKGMKNRVSVARALIHDPPVLVMDEPASGLDPRARIELRDLLKVLSKQGKAILISSHILTELSEICTGAVFIERGKLLRAGSMEDLNRQSAEHRILMIRPLENAETVLKFLLIQPNVSGARLNDGEIEVDLKGEDTDCCALLGDLCRQGFKILEFKPVRANLEQIFMTVTKGHVQ